MKTVGVSSLLILLLFITGAPRLAAQAPKAGGASTSNASTSSKTSTSKSSQPQSSTPLETGPEEVPVVYNGQFVELADKRANDNCRSMLVQYLWGIPRSGGQWTPFQVSDSEDDLATGNLPKMNPFISFDCTHGKGPDTRSKLKAAGSQVPIILHGSLWRMGTTPGTWSQVTSQWQVYRRAYFTDPSDTKKIKLGILADGYRHPTKADVPTSGNCRHPLADGDPPECRYQQPSAVAWLAKPALYNNKQARFVGISCFYDWDGKFLEDASRLQNISVSYKIATVAVVPDNVDSFNSILTAMFPGLKGGGGLAGVEAVAPPPRNIAPGPTNPGNVGGFDPTPPDTIVPGGQVRFQLKGKKQTEFTWDVKPVDASGPEADASVDNYGTLKMSKGATAGALYRITATPRDKGPQAIAHIRVASILPCLVASGGVDISSLPSDINITLSVQDSNKNSTPVLSLTAVGDTTQSAEVGKAFKPITVLLKGASGNPWGGQMVTFAAPNSGPGASLSATTSKTDSSGQTQVTATANQAPGDYDLTATAGGLTIKFHLKNTPSLPAGVHAAAPTGGPLNREFQEDPIEYGSDLADAQDQAPARRQGGGVKNDDAKSGSGGDQSGGGQNPQKQTSDCSNTGASGCTASHTIRARDREYWDFGLGLSAIGVKEPQYSPSSPTTRLADKNHAGSVYGFLNFYPFAALGNKSSFYPGLVAGIPVTGKVFYFPFFGISESVLGWWKRAPVPINIVWGMVYLNQETVVGKTGGGYQIDHARVIKSMLGVELPVSALVSKIKSLGGSSSTGNSGNKSQGSQSQ